MYVSLDHFCIRDLNMLESSASLSLLDNRSMLRSEKDISSQFYSCTPKLLKMHHKISLLNN